MERVGLRIRGWGGVLGFCVEVGGVVGRGGGVEVWGWEVGGRGVGRGNWG